MAPNQPKDNWDKASIIGQILSGVLLATIALLIKTGTDDITNSLKKGDLVRSMISDLASEGNKNIKPELALIALDHSLGNQEQAMLVEIAEEIIKQGRYDDFSRSVAFRIIEQRAPARAQKIKDDAEKLLQANSKVREDLRSSADPTALVLPSPTPAPEENRKQVIVKVLPNLVLIQFRNEGSRSTAEALRSALSAAGFFAPGVDRVEGNYSNSIRYFHKDDQALAGQVNEIVRNFLKSKNMALGGEPQYLSSLRNNSQSGQIEIWLDF